MPAKYVVSHRARTGFQWQLVASNGRVIATSERFETRRAVLSSIESARKNAPTAVVEDAAWRAVAFSGDRREGVAAFNEKRPPEWPGE